MIVFEDEASFRQTPTLHATWARVASQPQIPTRGERNTQKIFGAVRLDTAQFIYLHQQDYFQWETYVAFLDQVLVPAFYRRGHRVFLIQDNASYHKKKETYQWFAQNPYCPKTRTRSIVMIPGLRATRKWRFPR